MTFRYESRNACFGKTIIVSIEEIASNYNWNLKERV